MYFLVIVNAVTLLYKYVGFVGDTLALLRTQLPHFVPAATVVHTLVISYHLVERFEIVLIAEQEATKPLSIPP
jgi:hypothetical protein